jgi:hypothetical protein
MKKVMLVMAMSAAMVFAGEASAKGCLKGAAVGGVGGHFAGHHSLLGAGAGCLVGRHMANKHDRKVAAQQQSSAAAAPATTAPVAPAANTTRVK